jgi:hypothetical protein
MLTQLSNEQANEKTRFNMKALTFNTENKEKNNGDNNAKIRTR